MADAKRCPSCGLEKPLGDFYRLARSKDGLQGYCKPCANSKRIEWKKANRSKEREWRVNAHERRTDDEKRDASLRKRHHISLVQYRSLLAEQGGMCAGCRTDHGERLQVDHDHGCCSGRTTCGQCVRGLLCFKCNAALGNVNDSKETLVNLINYLATPDQCEPVWGN